MPAAPLSEDEIAQLARRMGLDKTLREHAEALRRAAGRQSDYAPSLPAAWTPTTEPA